MEFTPFPKIARLSRAERQDAQRAVRYLAEDGKTRELP
jgi:hypothetical protein